jgi:predicted Zn finger-like uncharacterized protein
MDVSCPACAARYTADDDKLRGKTARMRCKACNTVWLVSGAGAPPVSSKSPPPMSVDSPVSKRPSASPPPLSGQDSPASKRAAVVKRGVEREKRDLFGGRDEEVMSSKAPSERPPPSFGFTGVGARNETSVLFRVDQLANERVDTPEYTPGVGGRPTEVKGDDEGVIDLKALASSPPRAMGMPVAPLFSEPPPVTLEVDDNGRPNAKPRSKLAVAFGVVVTSAVLVAAGFAVSLAFRSEEPVKRTAAIVVPPPPPPAASSAAPEPPPAATTASDDADAKDTKTKKGKGRKGKNGPITNKTPAPAKTAVKPADPCGCHGDFNCILACTAHSGK